jgi:hypothetical protein
MPNSESPSHSQLLLQYLLALDVTVENPAGTQALPEIAVPAWQDRRSKGGKPETGIKLP